MLPLLQLLPPNVAGQQCSAVGIHAIGEVLAGQADPRALPPLQLQLIHKAPLLHAASLKYMRTSAVGMLRSSRSVMAATFTLLGDSRDPLLLQNQGMAEGIVYVLTNPAMPGMVKIGRTSREMEARLSELYSTGVPLPFECAYAARVGDENKVERAFHQAFGPYRVNLKREFFSIEPEQAIALLELMAVEDVTPAVQQEAEQVDVEAKAASDRFKKARKPPLNFLDIGVPIGSQLRFIEGNHVCTVIDPRRVEYEGESWSMSRLAQKLAGVDHRLSGSSYFTFQGRKLSEIYNDCFLDND